MSSSIVLCMIVRNEASVIERALASVKEKIGYWVVVDTGSTDNTKELVIKALHGVAGQLHNRPWVNFAHNRTESLQLARGFGTHALVLDADDIVEGDFPNVLDPNVSYSLPVRHGNLLHSRPHLLATATTWCYEGVVHEAAVGDGAVCEPIAEGPTYIVIGGGARSQRSAKDKFLADAALLKTEYEKNPSCGRTVFYLAQSYEDAGVLGMASHYYELRSKMGGWDEETYIAAYRFARCKPSVESFLQAWQMRPHRAEALVAGAAFCRTKGLWSIAKLLASQAVKLQGPSKDVLFFEPDCTWRAYDEASLASYYLGERQMALHLAECAIGALEDIHPQNYHTHPECDRLVANMELCATPVP